MAENFPMRWHKYLLLDHLDSGGMADVYLAVYAQPEMRTNRVMAVKRIRESHQDVPEWIDMFRNEIQVLLSLQSPHIVQTFDFDIQSNTPYVVMEYIESISLKQIVQQMGRRFLDTAVIVEIFLQTAKGLLAAHTIRDPLTGIVRPIVHRDLSPHNVIVSSAGIVKIIDFGIAKNTATKFDSGVSQIKGKPSYMSPEQVRGDGKIDARTDIFSLGICLWECLTMHRLFDSPTDSAFQIANRITSTDQMAADPRTINPALPAELAALCLKMLEKDPDRRVQSAADLVRAFDEIQTKLNLSAGPQIIKSLLDEEFASAFLEKDRKLKFSLQQISKDTHENSEFYDTPTLVTEPYRGGRYATRYWIAAGMVGIAAVSYFVMNRAPIEVPRANRKPAAFIVQGVELSDEERIKIRDFKDEFISATARMNPEIKTELENMLDKYPQHDRTHNYLSHPFHNRLDLMKQDAAFLEALVKEKNLARGKELIRQNEDMIKAFPPNRRKRLFHRTDDE